MNKNVVEYGGRGRHFFQIQFFLISTLFFIASMQMGIASGSLLVSIVSVFCFSTGLFLLVPVCYTYNKLLCKGRSPARILLFGGSKVLIPKPSCLLLGLENYNEIMVEDVVKIRVSQAGGLSLLGWHVLLIIKGSRKGILVSGLNYSNKSLGLFLENFNHLKIEYMFER